MRTAPLLVVLTAAFVLAMGGEPSTQAKLSQSAGPAATLVKLMSDRGLAAIAAPDPREPGRFVAALCFPGTQLLVISATYPVPELLERRVSNREYRDVYMDLQGDATREGRFFVQDMHANGLMARPDSGAAVDIVYENGVTSTTFAGSGKTRDVSPADYDAKFVAADQRYAEMLDVLVVGLKSTK